MAEIVNLRMARKRAARRDEEAKATANRTAFGMPKTLRDVAAIETKRADRRLDGQELDRGEVADASKSDTSNASVDNP